ncbi:unnamed protein product [Linum trigynum]|uniref:CCHC-type domain-containing protein n=1 Tax=Linum trigynum TaxID=586398 RepID=A0AAV2E5A4_9ROSI
MLSTGTPQEILPATDPTLSGRPPDPPSQLSQPQPPVNDQPAVPTGLSFKTALMTDLSFKAALTGQSASSPSKTPQWTFIGTNDIETGTFQGEPELKISTNLKERLCQPWKRTLIVRLLGRSINYSYLCSQLRRLWRPVGSLEILDLNDDTFLTTFGNDQDYLRALTGGPWVILDHYLVVHQWSPTFRTSDKPHRSVVAWVQFPELPVHFYHREVLFAIGNLIGRTVKLDYHTEKLERGKFARIAIDLDMSKPLPTRIRLDGAWQGVLYENLPTICYSCGRIGHTEEACPSRNPTPPLPLLAAENLDCSSQPAAESPEIPSGYGPWMQVVRKARKQNRKQESNQAQTQGSNKGNKQESWRDSGLNKGKGVIEAGKASSDTKGKHEHKANSKMSRQGNNKGKGGDEGAGTNGNKLPNGNKEWRPVGPKESLKASTNISAEPNKPGPSTVNLQPGPVPAVLVTGPNNTKIQVLNVPELRLPQKENCNPNSGDSSVRNTGDSSIRQHFPRQKKDRPLQPKGMKLKTTNKPLQIHVPGKKEDASKQKQGKFPLTIQAIEEFCSSAHKRIDPLMVETTGIEKEDVAMLETSTTGTPGTPPQTGGIEPSCLETA